MAIARSSPYLWARPVAGIRLLLNAPLRSRREAYASGLRWTFAPMLDIARDPRWGELLKEQVKDPFLCGFRQGARARLPGQGLQRPGASRGLR